MNDLPLPEELVKRTTHAISVRETLAAIPNGWAKLSGRWVELKYMTSRGGYVVIDTED